MPDELETILRLVAEGRLSPDEAAPIIAALGQASEDRATALDSAGATIGRHGDRVRRHLDRAERRLDEALGGGDATGRRLRIRVTEGGRQVVNLRIPIGFVDRALGFVPGIGADQADRIRDAVRSGSSGTILDIDDDGDGVQISVE